MNLITGNLNVRSWLSRLYMEYRGYIFLFPEMYRSISLYIKMINSRFFLFRCMSCISSNNS